MIRGDHLRDMAQYGRRLYPGGLGASGVKGVALRYASGPLAYRVVGPVSRDFRTMYAAPRAWPSSFRYAIVECHGRGGSGVG